MEVKLRRLGPNDEVKILKVPKECRTRIWLGGRGTSCQIYTKSQYASRQHFTITYKEQNYFISDLQTTNGTFLNDEKLECEKPLTFGSVIGVGVPSEMQDSPDCIVFVFEAHSFQNGLQSEKQADVTKNDEVLRNEMTSNLNSIPITHMEIEIDPPSDHVEDSSNINKNSENMDTSLSDSSSSDIVLIEPSLSIDRPKPAKIRKLNDSEVITSVKTEPEHVPEPEPESVPVPEPESLPVPVPDKNIVKNACVEDEDIFAYEALTQVDEPQIKPEPECDFLNYSLQETLIEISDSDDDLSPDLKGEGSKSPEGDDDDDVVVLETIIRSKQSIQNDFQDVKDCEIDELTETDKKWMGLLKVEKQEDFLQDDEDTKIMEVDELEKETAEEMIVDEPEEPENLITCAESLTELSVNDSEESAPEPAAETLFRVETHRKIIKNGESKSVQKKSVRFDLVPQIKYIEFCSASKLTPSQRGRLRFSRIIFNICNWNTHWLEECKKVAPEKIPPDICDERLRKIPKKFLTHMDYMTAFIPAMLLNLWNKIKNKWIASGESGFKQTIACDSYEDFQSENLSVFKCTGLAQDVNAHKQLIREGQLVLLRMHQVHNPKLILKERYSKKLGYLVFGFIESRIYERYDKQPLHQSLAERCASVYGDLHLVRLTILVKKRPSFQLDNQKLIQLTVLQQISQEIKMFKGICFLPESPLCTAILKPQTIDKDVLNKIEHDNEELVFKGPLDGFQSEIIRDLSNAFSCTSSLLFSIHGAAGTGKGQVIMGLILQLLYGNKWREKRPKILLCCPWSIPLDEMVVRLKNHRQTMVDPFSIVRVGPIREVKPEVRHLCLSHLAANLRNSDERYNADGRKLDAEIEVIKEADVICTTCVSAGISKMCTAFEKLLSKDKNKKVICIMDEAMSCKEPDSLIPLLLGVTHLLLVGDTYQLEPTFSEAKIHSVGFDNSLFVRVFKNFANLPKDLWPLYILKTQYRMNSNLSKFTSQLVYSTLLQRPSVKMSNSIENIKQYLFLVDNTPENLGKDEKEKREALIVSQLVKTVRNIAKTVVRNPVRFAVITCNSKQIENLHVFLHKREFPDVQIDVIQAFQGREFDVVFFVYDGRKMAPSYLATAFTRARCSLFIFTSAQAKNGNSFFSKTAEQSQKDGFLKYVQPDMTIKDWEDIVTGV